MTAKRLPEDEVFFREYNRKRLGERRSLARARELARRLRVDDLAIPVLSVVGSKGKGTAATYAAAYLSSTGLNVGLVSSPPFRTNRERVRYNGEQLNADEYREMAASVADAIHQLPADRSGYLSPAGCFTVGGVSHLVRRGCDVLVLEEGLGGISDEISLFPPVVLAVTPIFSEHVDILGSDVRDIAQDLVGVVSSGTHAIISAPQTEAVNAVVRHAGAAVDAEVAFVADGLEHWIARAEGLSKANARVGVAAGKVLAKTMGAGQADIRVMETINLPGRLSTHLRRRQRWLVDAAIDETGMAAAVEWCKSRFGEPEAVLICLPDIKDVAGGLRAVAGASIIPVRVGESYLTYDRASWPVPLETWAAARKRVEELRGVILAIGTVSFIGVVLDYLNADCGRAYAVERLAGIRAAP